MLNDIMDIAFPGGFLLRVIRYFLKRTPLYPHFNISAFSQAPDNHRENITVAAIAGIDKKKLFMELSDFEGVWIYLHGSQADSTANSFSDYDDLIIIDITKVQQKQLRNLIKALNRVDMRFCRIDNLQHHGHWIISRQSLDNYDESFVPLVVLKNAMVIRGPQELSYTVDFKKTKEGLRKNILSAVKSIACLYDDYNTRTINAYNLKCLIGSFLLIPAYIFQYNGESISKPDAIAKARANYTDRAYACIVWATYCRNNWHKVLQTRGFNKLKYFSYTMVNPHIYRYIVQRILPRVNLNKLEFDFLDPESVNAFIQESQKNFDA